MSETDLAFARAALMSVVRGADADDVVQVSCRGRFVHLSGLAFRMLVDPRSVNAEDPNETVES